MDGATWTVSSTLKWTQGYLARKGDANARVSAQWLIGAACGLSRIELYTNYDKPLQKDELTTLRGMIERRVNGEPLQYITGQAPFRTISVAVEPGVLIPRPETEVTVGEALVFIPKDAPSTVVDMCCGSGCIACSIAVERPLARVYAGDISSLAVRLTRKNADELGVSERVSVAEGDLFEALPKDVRGQVNVIVSNPPYIPHADLATLPTEVARFEPALALDGGEDGLDIFRRLLASASDVLAPAGALVVELHEDTVHHAAELADGAGLNTHVVDDLTGRPRVLVARR